MTTTFRFVCVAAMCAVMMFVASVANAQQDGGIRRNDGALPTAAEIAEPDAPGPTGGATLPKVEAQDIGPGDLAEREEAGAAAEADDAPIVPKRLKVLCSTNRGAVCPNSCLVVHVILIGGQRPTQVYNQYCQTWPCFVNGTFPLGSTIYGEVTVGPGSSGGMRAMRSYRVENVSDEEIPMVFSDMDHAVATGYDRCRPGAPPVEVNKACVFDASAVGNDGATADFVDVQSVADLDSKLVCTVQPGILLKSPEVLSSGWCKVLLDAAKMHLDSGVGWARCDQLSITPLPEPEPVALVATAVDASPMPAHSDDELLTAPACGNGKPDKGEECDDGNKQPDDGCDPLCALETPEKGAYACLQAGKPCVLLPQCGNGKPDKGEQCDNPPGINYVGCTKSCQLTGPGWIFTVLAKNDSDNSALKKGMYGPPEHECGDGKLAPWKDVNKDWRIQLGEGELCDEGDKNANTPNAACREDCTPQRCGDGIADDAKGEKCDEGVAKNSDAPAAGLGHLCRTNCKMRGCGDGIKDVDEDCDDGNTTDGDGCSDICKTAVCGNKKVEAGETCDNGDNRPGDGCSASCRLERGYHWNAVLKTVYTKCGDELVAEPVEACDDGNSNQYDGCHECKAVEDARGLVHGSPFSAELGVCVEAPVGYIVANQNGNDVTPGFGAQGGSGLTAAAAYRFGPYDDPRLHAVRLRGQWMIVQGNASSGTAMFNNGSITADYATCFGDQSQACVHWLNVGWQWLAYGKDLIAMGRGKTTDEVDAQGLYAGSSYQYFLLADTFMEGSVGVMLVRSNDGFLDLPMVPMFNLTYGWQGDQDP